MNYPTVILQLPDWIALIGGALLIACLFQRSTKLAGSRIFRMAILMAAVCSLAFAVIGFADTFMQAHLPAAGRALILEYQNYFAGACVGILILLFVSGEWSAYERRKKTA